MTTAILKTKIFMQKIMAKLENNTIFSCLRKSLILMMPIIVLGSFSTVLLYLPWKAFQLFITTWLGGSIAIVLQWVNIGTTQCFSMYLIFLLAYVYARRVNVERTPLYIANAFLCYIITTLTTTENVGINIFAPENMAIALVVTLLSCYIFNFFMRKLTKIITRNTFLGLDFDFQTGIVGILPLLLCVIIFIAFKYIFITVTDYASVIEMLADLISKLFVITGYGMFGSILYTFLNGFLGIIGIHSGYVLTAMLYKYYEFTGINSASLENGVVETALPHIINSGLLNNFVFIGGAGATLCLMLALCFNLKNNFNRKLFGLGIVPAMFNITEVALLGFPILFNPLMLIPFVFTPVVLLLVSTFATYIGLVPVCSVITSWSTPVLVGSYLATGSWAGILLQIICIIIGTLIYLPFVKMAMVVRTNIAKQNVNELTELLKQREQNGQGLSLKQCDKRIVAMAHSLITDLRVALNTNDLELHYQPQITLENQLYGVEALLRWNHPVAGYVYPPLIIELAAEENILDEMGYRIIELSCKTLDRLSKNSGHPLHLAVNISPTQLENEHFYERVKSIVEKYEFARGTLCFEITEQVALVNTNIVSEQINKLRELGIAFHMDDFGMGHSSMIYLQSNEFEAVKLDGSLTKQMVSNKRSQNIISGINNMSKSLNYDLIAEYVETDEQRRALAQMGCNIYQGYLYSPALPLPLLEDYLIKQSTYTQPDEMLSNDNLYI